jgi:hypothetical protein
MADGVAPAVPTAPAHGRGEGDFVADDDAEFFGGFSEAVLGPEGNDVFARSVEDARDHAAGGVEP